MSVKYPQYPLTTFPESVDEFEQFLDITTTDYSLIKEYQEALGSGDVTTAQSVLSQIPQATQKIISSMRLNQLRDAILAMEKFYSTTDISGYINSKQTEWQNIINQFDYIGTYNATTQYSKNNIVDFTYNGVKKLYLNIYESVTPIDTNPLNETYWRVFTIQGQKGDNGVGATFAFTWDGSVNYTTNTIVVWDNAWWNCTQANSNQQPQDGSDYWQLVLNVTQAIYPVQGSIPTNMQEGELWFKVV